MQNPIIHELTGPTMLANLASEIVGIFGTVVLLERYISWRMDLSRRPVRMLFVSSLGRRLDQLVLEWGWVLSFLASLTDPGKLESLHKAFGPLQARLNALLPEHVLLENRRIIESARSAESIKPHVQDVVIDKLAHLISRVDDVLDEIDAGASIMSTSMLDPLIELREELLISLRGVTDLRDLLANPTSEGARIVFTSAVLASFPGDTYLESLTELWESIPTHRDTKSIPANYLQNIPSLEDQAEVVREFLKVLFPEHDLLAIAKTTVVAPHHLPPQESTAAAARP